MKIKLFFLWRDFWIGFYWDNVKRILYICPVPMFGVKIQLAPKPKSEKTIYKIIHRNEDFTYAEDKDGKLAVFRTNPYPSDEFFDRDTQFVSVDK